MNIKQEIINFIRVNRLSTTEIADAMGKVGHLRDAHPLNSGKHCVGEIRHLVVNSANNSSIHKAITFLEKNQILLVTSDREAIQSIAFMGELMIKAALLYQQAEAIVTTNPIRDAARIKRENYSVWANGVSPIGAVNSPDQEMMIGMNDSGILIADDGGVVVIPEKVIDSDLLIRLQLIEDQEDLWSYCINTLKWTTHKTIVEKHYLQDQSEFPDSFKVKIAKLAQGFTPLF